MSNYCYYVGKSDDMVTNCCNRKEWESKERKRTSLQTWQSRTMTAVAHANVKRCLVEVEVAALLRDGVAVEVVEVADSR